jgi:hypothetical protein
MKTLFTLIVLPVALTTAAQDCNKVTLSLQSQITSNCKSITMSMLHDQQDKPYLYVANKEAGLKVYDIKDSRQPKLATTISTKLFSSLHVMNLAQQGNFLYLAIGNHFNNKQQSGMAIVDVSDPSAASFVAYWALPNSSGGSGIIKVQGNYAYLGAMGNGLIILDVTDKKKIKYVSQFIPDINYPDPKPKKSLYNARGMEVKGDIVYMCYDAGGLRIINTSDKTKPVETGRYSNPVMNGKPRAYNNLVVADDYAYIAVDYCGMEILNIKDSAHISPVGWWNPYGCPKNNWFTSPIYANEIAYDMNCKLIFLSTGRSDLAVVNVADPTRPVLCKEWGGPNNKMGTWGLSLYKDQLYLSYICSLIPFPSNWTGIKILSYSGCGK